MTFRDVILRLSVEKSPDNAGKIASFVDEVEKAYDAIHQQNEKSSRQLGGSIPGVDSASFRQTTEQRVQAEREAGQRVVNERATIAELEAQVEADRRANQLARLRKFTDQRVQVERALAAAIEEIRSQVSEEFPGDEAALNTAIEGARQAAAEKLKKIDAKLQEERVKLAQQATRDRLALLKEEQKALESAETEYRSMQEQVRAARTEVKSAVAEIGASIMTTTRGFVALGLAGEEDMEKIVQGLLKVQGAFDIVSGSIQTWIKIEQAIEGVRKVILATAAAEEALAAASAARAAAQAAGGVAGGARGAVGAVGDVAAGAAGGAIGGRLSRGRLAGNLTRRIGGRFAAGASRAAPLAALGMGVGLGLDYFSGDGYSREGFGERAGTAFIGARNLGRLDRLTGLGTGAGGMPLSLIGPPGALTTSGSVFRNLVNSDDVLASREAMSEQLRARHAQQVSTVNAQLPALRAGFGVRARTGANLLAMDLEGAGPQGQQRRIAEEILRMEEQIAQAREASARTAGMHEQLITELNQEQARLEERKRDLVIQRATVGRDAAQAELEASQRTLENIDQTIQQQMTQIQALQSALSSSRERFGLLDAGTQESILDIFRRGQAGEQLNPDELRLLKSVGADAANAIVAGQAEERAKLAGADELFRGEREQLEKLAQDVERNVSVRAEVRWNVEFDKTALDEQAQALEAAVKGALSEQMEGIIGIVSDAMQGVTAGVKTSLDGFDQRFIDGAGGR